jgi:hypothetical protein
MRGIIEEPFEGAVAGPEDGGAALDIKNNIYFYSFSYGSGR